MAKDDLDEQLGMIGRAHDDELRNFLAEFGDVTVNDRKIEPEGY